MKASQMFTFSNGYIMDFILCYQSSEADVCDCRKMSSDFITCYWQNPGKWDDVSNTDICNAFGVKCQYILFYQSLTLKLAQLGYRWKTLLDSPAVSMPSTMYYYCTA